jgi:hypothetical protein
MLRRVLGWGLAAALLLGCMAPMTVHAAPGKGKSAAGAVAAKGKKGKKHGKKGGNKGGKKHHRKKKAA